MPKDDTFRVSAVLLVSSYLLSEGNCISFADIDVGLMTTFLVSSLEEIESTIIRTTTVEFMLLQHQFSCGRRGTR